MTGKGKYTPDERLLDDPLIQEAFNDPRFKHLRDLTDYDNEEPDDVNYDRGTVPASDDSRLWPHFS